MLITINELHEHMDNIPCNNIADRLMQFETSLRGTRSYWEKCKEKLIDLLDQLGTPTIFFTLSADDMQWPKLHALMPSTPPTNP